ncbi:MAG: IS66 family transposase [Planctomycetes bacterium]|nr:IS66 family transposase [Planctomycetota bacterium]
MKFLADAFFAPLGAQKRSRCEEEETRCTRATCGRTSTSYNVVFDYTPGHSREGPLAFLGDYAVHLQVDVDKGYDALFAKRLAQEVACWAHARRKFFDAQGSDPGRAVEMLVLTGDLCQLEQRAQEEGLDRDQIKALRQEQSKPILPISEKRLAKLLVQSGQMTVTPRNGFPSCRARMATKRKLRINSQSSLSSASSRGHARP